MAIPASRQYLDIILGGLSQLAWEVSWRGKLNLTDIHVMSEDFYAGFLNIVYDLHLRNANITNQNAEGIDLVDDENNIIIQVSSICKKNKIDHSLQEVGKHSEYQGYRFRFLPLVVGNANYHRRQTYTVPAGVSFDPKEDIIDVPTIQKELQTDLFGQKLENAAEFVKRNLHFSFLEGEKLMSGLEYIIVELSKDGSEDSEIDTKLYQIGAKIAFNGLSYGKEIINEYYKQYKKVSRIYEAYSSQGQSKSKAVLQKIHKIYLSLKQNYSGDDLFRNIENEICRCIDVRNMPENFTQEELEMCADILMVHAFIECDIFEKPV